MKIAMRSATPHSFALYLLLLVPSLHLAAASTAYPWPAGVDPSVKYWPPGCGPPSKRWLQEFAESVEVNQSSKCSAVRKMSSENPGEKYYWDWEHEARSQQGFLGLNDFEDVEDTPEETPTNTYKAPLRTRNNVADEGIIGALLGKRQNFQCATGTYACTDIGVPGSCCKTDEVCEKIPDIGYGNVGCCPSGQSCSGNLSGCGSDKKTCSSNQGGGCCLQGYNCSPNGCVPESKSASAATTCSSGYYACPSNVAGGCCPSGRLCGVTDCPTMTTTGTAAAISGDTCPAGYYTCAAQYNGGCCRVGRDCGITECPERAVTISGAGGAGGVLTMTAPASCATGWQTCASSLGGGCCPTKYTCGFTDCPAVTVGASIYVISGQTLTTAVVLSATEKSQPTAQASIAIPNNGRRGDSVTKVVVVVAVIVGVAAAAAA